MRVQLELAVTAAPAEIVAVETMAAAPKDLRAMPRRRVSLEEPAHRLLSASFRAE